MGWTDGQRGVGWTEGQRGVRWTEGCGLDRGEEGGCDGQCGCGMWRLIQEWLVM